MTLHALVTGAAGFIGSHLVEALLAVGGSVRAVDALTPSYDLDVKQANTAGFAHHDRCEWIVADLRRADLDALCDGVDVVFHLAGQPGVRESWSAGFEDYVEHNVVATQRLLEAAVRADVGRFVYASSSAVYGNLGEYPTTERAVPAPHSPYGVTKLAGEHLCGLYAANWGLPTVALRYFTVYGPRQRPDMAMHRLVEAALDGTAFPLFGDGSQVREFTDVGDVVAANLLAGTRPLAPGTIVNVAGGEPATLRRVIDVVEDLVGRPVHLDPRPSQAGDVARTGGSTDRARRLLGWQPQVSLEAGLLRQVDWHRGRRHGRGDHDVVDASPPEHRGPPRSTRRAPVTGSVADD